MKAVTFLLTALLRTSPHPLTVAHGQAFPTLTGLPSDLQHRAFTPKKPRQRALLCKIIITLCENKGFTKELFCVIVYLGIKLSLFMGALQ